jgi:hypothetical protein
MGTTTISINQDYWSNFKINKSDLEFLYNYLLELETPQTPEELVKALICERIHKEKKNLESQQLSDDPIYLPKCRFMINQVLSFPSQTWKKGKVLRIREGNNPELPPFEVIEVLFESGEVKYFASGIVNHILNQPVVINIDDPNLISESVFNNFGSFIEKQLQIELATNSELVSIASKWFPRALLVDINMGYLNMAEALLEMENGKPLPTQTILEQIELPTDVNLKLTEFSLNLALQEDGRFDEVGITGEVLWYLRRLEPEWVQQTPPYLVYNAPHLETTHIKNLLKQLDSDIHDEIEVSIPLSKYLPEITLSLIFPHWQSGTLPLSDLIGHLFPSAHQSPRVKITFVDGDSGQKIPGWVVRPLRYAFGLKDWYRAQGIFPGSLLHIIRSNNPGEVIIRSEKRRPTREWIRTALVGADGGIVFAMLKQLVSTNYNERMAIIIPDIQALEKTRDSRRRTTITQTVISTMFDLAKLNPQGQVHALEIYAAVNLQKRCPPSVILAILNENSHVKFLGDLYYRLNESENEAASNE